MAAKGLDGARVSEASRVGEVALAEDKAPARGAAVRGVPSDRLPLGTSGERVLPPELCVQ